MSADIITLSVAAGPDSDRKVVAMAWPTGRPIYAYTADELAVGVDVYTRRMKTTTKASDADTH